MDKKKKIFVGIGAVALVAATYFGYQHLTYVSTDNAQVQAHTVMLAPKVGGVITVVNVTDGQRVKKDEVLVEIDSRDYENTLRQRQAELSSLQARLHDAEKNFARLKDLFSKGAVAKAQYDKAYADLLDARAKSDAIEAQLSQAKLNLEHTKVIAPADGSVARASAEVGQLAAPGVPVVGFVSDESRWVMANFKETDIEDIKVGATAYVEVDAIGSETFEGQVESISSATGSTFTLLPPDNATGNFTKVVQRVPVKISFPHLSAEQIQELRAGLSSIVKVHK